MNRTVRKISIVFSIVSTITLIVGCRPHSEWKSYSGDKRIEKSVDSLLKLMTIEEKIGQMAQFSCNWDITGPVMPDDFEIYLQKGEVGSIFNAYTVDGVRKLQETALAHSRLKIPILFGYDVIHGYRTIFPIPLAESCTWDLDAMRRSARIAAEEATSEGIHWTFAPMVDVTRDPRWGRVMEGAGEDAFLGSRIAEARVEGFQGSTDGKKLGEINTMLACVKHFAAYGASEAGRDYNPAELSDNTLMNYYMPPYLAAKEAGAATFMASFNEIDGVPSTASRRLLTDILRDEWDFRGFVVSDYTGVNELVPHGVAADEKEAGELALNAGLDMDMTGAVYSKHLLSSLREGRVREADIDMAVRRILEMKFLLGLFDDPYRYLDNERERQTIMKPEFLAEARKSASSSIVLLKNENSLLPIEKSSGMTVALIGPMVKDKINQNGEWAGKGDRDQSVSAYEGLTAKYAGSNVKFIYAEGCGLTDGSRKGFGAAISAARRADVVLAFMGEDFNWSGEAACRTDIRLPEQQRALLAELKKTGKPIALIVMNGRPLDLSWEDANLDAIVEAWYLGTMSGHGLADVLSGDVCPSGRLTMSFPRNVGQVPVYYNAKNTGRPMPADGRRVDYRSSYIDVDNSPLYPFGYGLSYTTFELSNLRLSDSVVKGDGTVTASVDVTNTGDRNGATVVQMYIRDLRSSVTRPVLELKGFERVELKTGERRTVEFEVDASLLEFYGSDLKKRVEEGAFTLFVGQNSRQLIQIPFTYEK